MPGLRRNLFTNRSTASFMVNIFEDVKNCWERAVTLWFFMDELHFAKNIAECVTGNVQTMPHHAQRRWHGFR